MHYTIYKTTNLLNNKYYIGLHRTENIADGYMGSGKLLKAAFHEYGKENFYTEILYDCKSEKEMNAIEKILVVPDVETNYNVILGGYGGHNKGQPMSEASKKSLRDINLGKKHTKETKLKMSLSKKGKEFSEAHKRAMRIPKKNTEKMKGHVPWNKGLTYNLV